MDMEVALPNVLAAVDVPSEAIKWSQKEKHLKKKDKRLKEKNKKQKDKIAALKRELAKERNKRCGGQRRRARLT